MVVTYNTYANLNENKNKQKSGSERKANVQFGGEKLQETKLEPRFVLEKKKKRLHLLRLAPLGRRLVCSGTKRWLPSDDPTQLRLQVVKGKGLKSFILL